MDVQVLINIGIFIFMLFAITAASTALVLHLEREDMMPKFDLFDKKPSDDE